jgi:hypothetical protein
MEHFVIPGKLVRLKAGWLSDSACKSGNASRKKLAGVLFPSLGRISNV